MTEDEAKAKWCPFVRAWEGAGQSWATRPLNGANDIGLMTPEKSFCMGSACMAWRVRVGFEPATLAHISAAGGEAPEPEGYCGLAGPVQ